MTCIHCGTEIAATALICFRCGRSTKEPSRAAAPPPARGRGLWGAAAAAVVLGGATLFMGQSAYGQVPPELSWTLAGLAAAVLVWRLLKRRR